MILPDGSRVISVGPAVSATERDAIDPVAPAEEAPVPAWAIPQPNEPGTNEPGTNEPGTEDAGGEIEELPAVAPDSDTVNA
jgi:hypothetical protein